MQASHEAAVIKNDKIQQGYIMKVSYNSRLIKRIGMTFGLILFLCLSIQASPVKLHHFEKSEWKKNGAR